MHLATLHKIHRDKYNAMQYAAWATMLDSGHWKSFRDPPTDAAAFQPTFAPLVSWAAA